MSPSLILVGTGAAATALAARAVACGVRVSHVIGREEPSARALAERCGAQGETWDALPGLTGSEMVVVAVPDRALPDVAARLARLWPKGRTGAVAHLSGLLTADEGLGALRPTGVALLSWHPAKPLVRRFDAAQLDDALVCVESPDARGVEAGLALAHALRITPFAVEAARKPLYHAALSVGSNFTVVLAALMERLLREAGVDAALASALGRSLLAGTVHNLSTLSPGEALTGPIVRGDQSTVATHVAHLPPDLLPTYCALAEQAAYLAVQSGRLPREDAARLLETITKTRT